MTLRRALTPSTARTAGRRALAVPLALGLAVALSACGSDSLSSSESSGSASGAEGSAASPAASQAKVDALAAKVPEKVKTAGKLVVGVDTTYPPNEFLAEDGKTAKGMDIDLLNAVAQKLGVTTEWQNSNFDAIILGVTSGKYDVGMSSFTINPERKKSVNMVSYYSAGTLWVAPKGNPKQIDPDNACGKTIGIQKGTVQVTDLQARSKKCTDGGKEAIKLVIDDQQVKITAALTSGKVDAMAADSPVSINAIQQTNDQFEKVGDIYDSAPYGVVVPKDQTEFAGAIKDALVDLEKSGDYEKILTTWGGQDGAITDFSVNP